MSEEERTKILVNNIKLNINKQNVYEFGLCVEQWKQILDYIGELQQQNKKYKEVIDKAIEYIDDWLFNVGGMGACMDYKDIKDILDILKEVE